AAGLAFEAGLALAAGLAATFTGAFFVAVLPGLAALAAAGLAAALVELAALAGAGFAAGLAAALALTAGAAFRAASFLPSVFFAGAFWAITVGLLSSAAVLRGFCLVVGGVDKLVWRGAVGAVLITICSFASGGWATNSNSTSFCNDCLISLKHFLKIS